MTTILVLALAAQGAQLTFVPSGMTAKMRGYVPVRADMNSDASRVKKAPSNLTAPKYGDFKFGLTSIGFILDEPTGQPAKLYVDSNSNGDYTDDAPAKWDMGKGNMYSGNFDVMLKGNPARVNSYRFDPNDPQRPQLKNVVLYYPDFGYEGEAKFGENTYKLALSGPIAEGARIWVDRNGNGKNDGRSETVTTTTPFNFGGEVFEITRTGDTFNVQTSTKTVEEIPLPPDMSIGQTARPFKAKGMSGKEVQFPESYKGKIVMLDFWATWCGPCIAELPNLTKAYDKFRDRGFEILGITLDDKDMADKVNAFTKEKKMPWEQIYEGKGWDITIGKMYAVEGIPFCLLVDGDTGKILANGGELRGEALDKTLTKVFASR